MLDPPFPVVHDQLLCLADVEGVVGVLASHCLVTDLIPIGCLIVDSDQAYHCHVVCKLMMLESKAATLPWLNKEYRRGLSMHH